MKEDLKGPSSPKHSVDYFLLPSCKTEQVTIAGRTALCRLPIHVKHKSVGHWALCDMDPLTRVLGHTESSTESVRRS